LSGFSIKNQEILATMTGTTKCTANKGSAPCNQPTLTDGNGKGYLVSLPVRHLTSGRNSQAKQKTDKYSWYTKSPPGRNIYLFS